MICLHEQRIGVPMVLRGFDTGDFLSLPNTSLDNLDMFFAKHFNRSIEAIRILETDLYLSSSLVEIHFPTGLILSPKSLKL